jgi:hypothetical protein
MREGARETVTRGRIRRPERRNRGAKRGDYGVEGALVRKQLQGGRKVAIILLRRGDHCRSGRGNDLIFTQGDWLEVAPSA